MNHVARSLCEYLMSRNNDIAGYWGIGALCQNSIKENRVQFHFKVRPGELLRIYSYEILGSLEVTEKLVKPNILGLNIAPKTHHSLAEGNALGTGVPALSALKWLHTLLPEKVLCHPFRGSHHALRFRRALPYATL